MNAYEQLISFLDENKASYRLIDHAPEGRTEVVSGLRGNALTAAAKCIVVMVKLSKKEKVHALAVIPGDRKLNMNAIKTALGGEYATFATQPQAEALTGCVFGTILPFSFNPELKVFVDPALLGNDEIFFNAAKLEQSIALKGADYARLHGGKLLAIAQAGESPEARVQNTEHAAVAAASAEPVAGAVDADDEIRQFGKNRMSVRLYKIRHSLAHIMAQAVLELFPEAKPTIGPPVEHGFYYDFGMPRGFTQDDLEAIQKRMREVIKKGVPFVRREVSADEARAAFPGNEFKLELIDGLAKGQDDMGDAAAETSTTISFYTQDGFTDLCRGPHVVNSAQINPDAFKITSSSSAYWRGDEHNPRLQRIYGLAFETQKELDDHLFMVEEARKRDHRKLGAELEIFIMDDEVGPGLPLWQPNGAAMIEALEALAKRMERDGGYERVKTPHLTKEALFLRSGHLPYYDGGMYPPMTLDDGEKYYMKPMNCPFHHKLYAARPRSYRELPVRYAEYGTCYRYEQSGELIGLMRVRSMQMNDAHIYCTEEQFEKEFMDVIALYHKYFDIFDIKQYVMRLSLHDEAGLGKKYVDNKPLWLKTEDMVRNAMINGNVNFVERANEAAFYGPKIDVQITSAIGREFTLATNQVDFAVPPRFNLLYRASDGSDKTPLCLHRAPLSTHERLIGFLIEHYAGSFPLWLAPQQAVIVPIADRHLEFADQVRRRLEQHDLRVKVDNSGDRMQNKIRKAQANKVPYTLVIGDKEQAADSVAVRLRSGEDLGAMPVEAFLARVNPLIDAYAKTL